MDDFSKNPTCQHGPTVLLQRTNDIGELQDQFYACTASRGGKCLLEVLFENDITVNWSESGIQFEKGQLLENIKLKFNNECTNCVAVNLF